MRTRTMVLIIAFFGAMLCLAGQALAEPVIYSVSVVATGSLGGKSFSNALVIIKCAGDTANVTLDQNRTLWTNPTGTATVSVEGFPLATFAEPIAVSAANESVPPSIGVVSTSPPRSSVIDVFSVGLAGYDLKTAIGPVSGTTFYSMEYVFSTDLGDLNFQSVTDPATFSAIVGEATVTSALIEEALITIPDEEFVRNPVALRRMLLAKIEALEGMLIKQHFIPARNKLREDILKCLENWLLDAQPAAPALGYKAGILSLVGDLVARVEYYLIPYLEQ
jgi:hypothetical protein